jgi:alkaline phosphatase D
MPHMSDPLSSASGPSRRVFLVTGLAAVGGLVTGAAPALAFRDVTGANPFTLGVASGDPASDSVVLWTRLAPEPLVEDGLGGMPSRAVEVRWDVAEDEAFGRVVRRGTVSARPDAAHAVHVEVGGLRPGRPYWYRFTAMGHQSPAGRTATTPAGGALGSARFGVVSCARYEDGYFTAYRHLADERPDLVLHLGDYLYEYGVRTDRPRQVVGGEITTLADYRRRHALYKTDPDLQALHAAAPFAVVFDDHEVDNNWAGLVPEDAQTPEQFRARRAAAFQAYHEMMPLRRSARPDRHGMRLYRTLQWGGLAQLHMLDTRQYRDDQACGDGNKVDCPERFAPARTMLGATQEAWLRRQAAASSARWDVLGQQVFFSELLYPRPEGLASPLDSWNGYVAARQRVVDMFSTRPRNLVVLTGDVHNHYAATLPKGVDPEGPPAGVEFVTTSVTSGGDGQETTPFYDELLMRNPNVAFSNNRRGYLLCEASPESWTTHYRVVPYVTRPGAPLETRRSLIVEAGQPGKLMPL